MKRYLQLSWRAVMSGVAALAVSAVAQAQIQITEVMYDATVDDVWEWIEIRNTGASPVNLDGYYAFNLGDPDLATPNPSILSSLDPDTTINAGETMIIYDGFYGLNNPNNFIDQKFRDAWGISPTVKVLGAQFWPTMANTAGGQQQSIGFWPDVTSWRADMTPAGGGIGPPAATTTSFASTTFSLNFADFPVTGTVNGNSSITWTGNGSQQDGANWVQSVSGSNGAVTSANTLIGVGSDSGNPGVLSNFGPGPNAPGLYVTEIMYDPSTDSAAPFGEWVELYNNTGAAIDLTGYVLDDLNATGHAAANIAGGVIPAGGVGILFNGDLQTSAEFAAVWGPGLNLIPVTDWTSTVMSLNNNAGATTQDRIALWDSFEDYTATATEKSDHNLAIAKQEWNENNGFANASNASLTLASLDDASFPRTAGASWVASANGDGFGSILNSLRHPGGDVGSPGSFTVTTPGQPGDFDGDLDVDGQDFLIWQRGGSTTGPLDAGDLADWQANYGAGPLVAINAVPEPTSLVMLALALLPIAAKRKG